MNSLNALIARGAPAPTYNYLDSKNRAMNTLANQYRLQQLPNRQKMIKQKMQLDRDMYELDVYKTAIATGDESIANTMLQKLLPEEFAKGQGFVIKFPKKNHVKFENPRFSAEVPLDELNAVMDFAEKNKDGNAVGHYLAKAGARDIKIKSPEKSTGKAPVIREFKKGNQVITKQWNEELRQWDTISTGPRFKPSDDTDKEGKNLASRQKEARITLSKTYGMNEFSRIDETTGQKFADAYQFASRMLAEDPDMAPAKSANEAKRMVENRYKILDRIPSRKKEGWFSTGNSDEVRAAIRPALKIGIDTAVILESMMEKGWSREAAITEIRHAGIPKLQR